LVKKARSLCDLYFFTSACAGLDGRISDGPLLSSKSRERRMTKFHFHLRAGDELTLDHEGAEFPDYSAALREATFAAREILIEAIKGGKKHVAEAFVIANASGEELGNLPLATLLPKPIRNG
jgi:hypothetical protein